MQTKKPGTSFEAGRSRRARAPRGWRVLWRRVRRVFWRLQETLWRLRSS